jgi:hypothetical protein
LRGVVMVGRGLDLAVVVVRVVGGVGLRSAGGGGLDMGN